ncbi:hypothetical protein NDU88_006073 [Pleurodeles waltl]|uniref:Uncharacterized protein n=1 Tax=Pleurodeles waltl TaxID=8319 RepID=A0AAV7WX40_PLEWA|nr:hypothetical protein NDU88_006073 [Pleurodeles waltl]
MDLQSPPGSGDRSPSTARTNPLRTGRRTGGEGPGWLRSRNTDPSSRGSKGEPPQRPCVRHVSPRASHEPEPETNSKRSINRGLQITLLVPK